MVDFDKLIDKHLFREHKPKKMGRYYPSEVGNCMRKVWYSYKYPHQIEADLLKIFELGNIMHDFIVEVLKSEKTPEVELMKAELPFKIKIGNFLVSGRVDDLMLVKESGRLILLEVKSHRRVSIIKKPASRHIIQLQFYMHATGVNNGLILYIDKSTLQTKLFEVKHSKKKSKQIVKRFKLLHNNLTNNKLPLAEAKKNKDMKWMCGYCEYKDKCDKSEK